MQETETFLRRPLIRLAGGIVTPGALFVGMVIVLATFALAALAGRGLRRASWDAAGFPPGRSSRRSRSSAMY